MPTLYTEELQKEDAMQSTNPENHRIYESSIC